MRTKKQLHMAVTDLDEADGVTIDSLRLYMIRTGWRPAQSAGYECWMHDRLKLKYGSFVLRAKIGGEWVAPDDDDLGICIQDMAELEGRSVQALLRDINPRLRPGLPAVAEIHKHDGKWIGRLRIGNESKLVLGYFGVFGDGRLSFHPEPCCPSFTHDELLAQAAADTPCAFWPCDQDGNKVPLPMLEVQLHGN